MQAHTDKLQLQAYPYSRSSVSATLARNRELNHRWKNSNFSSPPSTSVITDLLVQRVKVISAS